MLKIIFIFSLFIMLQSIQAEPVSIHFQNAPVRSALTFLARADNKNIIIGNEVNEKISLNLEKIEPLEAINLILKIENLTRKEENGILLINQEKVLSKNKENTETNTDNASSNHLLFLHYAKASDIASLIQNKNHLLLSKNGAVYADNRTNSVLIHDDSTHALGLEKMIRALDIPMKQVLISARLVTIDCDNENEVGVRFGLNESEPILARINHSDTNLPLNIDLPAVSTQAGHFGLALFKIKPGIFVDLELSALQSEGYAKIISTPELIASNEEPANIQAGQEIPYQESTSSGATSVTFKKAVLSLKVTPQVISNQKVLLNLAVNQDSLSSKEILGVPAINTRSITTEVVVNNHQTIVLGGVYESTKNRSTIEIPLISELPILGKLFRYSKMTQNKRQLLIFVTPTIIAT